MGDQSTEHHKTASAYDPFDSRNRNKTEEQLEAERLEPAAIALRLHRAEEMLVSALELIDKQQAIISTVNTILQTGELTPDHRARLTAALALLPTSTLSVGR